MDDDNRSYNDVTKVLNHNQTQFKFLIRRFNAEVRRVKPRKFYGKLRISVREEKALKLVQYAYYQYISEYNLQEN